MKTLLALILISATFVNSAHAIDRLVMSQKVFKGAMIAAERRATPLITETNVILAMRKAQARARGEHLSAPVVIVETPLLEPGSFFKADIMVQSEAAKTNLKATKLTIDAAGLTNKQIRKIVALVEDPNWSLIGHFTPAVVVDPIVRDSGKLSIEIQLIDARGLNLNNVRGIKTLLDDVIKVAEESHFPVSAPVFSRKAAHFNNGSVR